MNYVNCRKTPNLTFICNPYLTFWHLLAESQQLKHQKNMWNLFIYRSSIFNADFKQISQIFPGVLIIEFEQINVSWETSKSGWWDFFPIEFYKQLLRGAL